MPGHYETIKAQLTQDIEEAIGNGIRIVYGRLVKPRGATPIASVITAVDRKNVGRQVQETYSFVVAIMMKQPDATDLTTDAEGFLFEKTDLLIQKLAPFDLNEPQASPGPYAGVASLRRVSAVKPIEREDTDVHIGVVLDFSCMATVYQ